MKQFDTDLWIENSRFGQPVIRALRRLLLEEGLSETIKWGMPVYTWNERNLIGLGAFKEHIALWFYQGALLKDPAKVLHNAQEGKTEGMRQWHFREPFHLDEALIAAYITESIENVNSGNVWKPQHKKELVLPQEFVEAFALDIDLKKAFYALTPGNQRTYADYISEAKREETRKNRIATCRNQILEGIGLNDKYRK